MLKSRVASLQASSRWTSAAIRIRRYHDTVKWKTAIKLVVGEKASLEKAMSKLRETNKAQAADVEMPQHSDGVDCNDEAVVAAKWIASGPLRASNPEQSVQQCATWAPASVPPSMPLPGLQPLISPTSPKIVGEAVDGLAAMLPTGIAFHQATDDLLLLGRSRPWHAIGAAARDGGRCQWPADNRDGE